jgi:uncharacterized protein (TIGR02246 family)
VSSSDELAIRNVVAALARTADGADVDAYVALFTADAVWDLPGAPRRGTDDIRAGAVQRRAEGLVGPGSHTRHVVTTLVVTVDVDDATASSTWLFFGNTASRPELISMGTYDDALVRGRDRGWRVRHRRITIG